MAWNKGHKQLDQQLKQIVDIKEKEILTVDKRGKVIKRELITETFVDDGQVLDKKMTLVQYQKPGKIKKLLNTIPLIKNAKSVKIIEEPDRVTIIDKTGKEVNEET